MDGMWGSVQGWSLSPMVGEIVSVIVGIVIINVLVRLAQRTFLVRIKGTDVRYRFRKVINFIGTIAAIVFITVVFSDRLGNLTVAFGVAGAGIAFALQEIIASVAGWAAVAVGNFFSVGDRVQLGAKGNYKNGSDIDLTLCGGKDLTQNVMYRIVAELDDLLLPYTIDLSIFEQLADPDLIEHIERVGLVFYERK